jgi:hypothetical protein
MLDVVNAAPTTVARAFYGLVGFSLAKMAWWKGPDAILMAT